MRKGHDHICSGPGCRVCDMLAPLSTVSQGDYAGSPDEISQRALIDEATGFLNVRSFHKKLDYELKRSRRYKRPVALCLIGIDGFNLVGEDYGQLATNEVLRKISELIRSTVRDVDIPAKYSAAWFAVIMPETNSRGASIIAERMRENIEQAAVSHQWQNFRFTASIGIASFPSQASDSELLLARCLEALQLSISRGGNRVCLS